LETNAKNENNFEDEERLLRDLPQDLKSAVLDFTHGELMERIHFFKSKN
jgi:hypothetical protein